MKDLEAAIRKSLRDPEYSESYAETFLDMYVATQIKVLREQRGLTQGELASAMGTTQAGVSRIENANYSGWSIGTLKKLARAFRVRLRISFEAYGSLPGEVVTLSQSALRRVAREQDPSIFPELATGNRGVVNMEQWKLSQAAATALGNTPYQQIEPTNPRRGEVIKGASGYEATRSAAG